ncbi:MAG: helix-turn-helix domain-containing protein [Hyphomicrobiaceae bacterium]
MQECDVSPERTPMQTGLRKHVFESREAAESYLSRAEPSVCSVTFPGRGEDFHVRYAGGRLASCNLHLTTNSGVEFSVRPSGQFQFLLPLKSGLSIKDKDDSHECLARRSALLLSPSAEGRGSSLEKVEALSLFVDVAEIRHHARILKDPDREPEVRTKPFDTIALDDPVGEALSRNLIVIFREMMTLDNQGLGALVRSSFDDVLLGLMAACVTVPTRDERIVAEPGDLIVRRAQEYISAHSSEPIRISDLATQFGVGLRSLQVAFQRRVGCSPREFLIRCRLQNAHQRLLVPGPVDSVTSIAAESGFTDFSYFAKIYRDEFGELPSETLRRGRR